MDTDSTNLQAPDFGPRQPDYPALAQLVRVTSPALAGTNIYPALVQQYAGSLVMRDREACYLWEPNGVTLSPSIYDCRLEGSYNGLPLFATACCVSAGFGSSSSGSAAPVCNIERTSLGTAAGASRTYVDIGPLTLPAGSLLVVTAAIGGVASGAVATFADVLLEIDEVVSLPLGAGFLGTMNCLSGVFTGTGLLRVSVDTGVNASVAAQAILVTGLAANLLDRTASASGLGSSPSSGATLVTTADCEYAQGGFLMDYPISGWYWLNGFSTGGQDLSFTVGTIRASTTEGYRTLSTAQVVNAALGNVTTIAWCGFTATYR